MNKFEEIFISIMTAVIFILLTAIATVLVGLGFYGIWQLVNLVGGLL